MSIAEFSSAIRAKAYKDWFSRIQDSVIKETTTSLRKGQQKASKTSFYITEQTISELIEKLTGGKARPEQIQKAFSDLRSYFKNQNRIKQIQEPYTDGKALYFPRVSFDTINRILARAFKQYESENNKISDYYQKGHVFGIATKTIEQSIDKLQASTVIDPQSKKLLGDILSTIHTQLEQEDLETSNMGSTDYELYAKYKKNKSRYIVELQLKEKNEASGRAVAPILNALRRYFDPSKLPVSEALGIKFREEDAFFKALIEQKGSPSYIDLIAENIVSILETGKRSKKKDYVTAPILIKKAKTKPKNSAINKTIKQQKEKIKKDLQKVKNLPVGRAKTQEPIVDLVSLTNIINTALAKQVSENMGDGTRKDVLNYRTGRFANSVEVERLMMSRNGMITAFYTYMKYPYATFSRGGRQELPPSRDPKLLISKSIREILQTQVSNRMRAVLV